MSIRNSSSARRWLATPAVVLLAALITGAPAAAAGTGWVLARRTADEVRTAVMEPGVGRSGVHPLPLAANWNAGELPGGFDQSYQFDQLASGHHLLPWIRLPHPDSDYDPARLDDAVRQLSTLGLPMAFLSVEWEILLESAYGTAAANGRSQISPFTPVAAWHAAGRRWGAHPLLRRLQAIYPDPPLVLFVSNNEQPRPRWPELVDSKLLPAGTARGDAAARQAIGDAWIARHRALQRGFRDGLAGSAWRRAARFVGYDAIGPAAYGRWPGWKEYSLFTPERAEPWPLAWDGTSASYYVNDWSPITDFTVQSPQVEAMNWVPMLDEAYRLNPDYWFELSVWDGQHPGTRGDKPAHYARLGQEFNAARYGGFVQYGMWLLRPRLVREFRNPAHDRRRFGPYFDAVIAAVDRVWSDPDLARFWRRGELLAAKNEAHPYDSAVDGPIAGRPRWFMPAADANPPRPWSLDTPLRVFSLVLEIGDAPGREWLLYAHSPAEARVVTTVRLPGGSPLRIVATRGGCFSIAHERTRRVERSLCA